MIFMIRGFALFCITVEAFQNSDWSNIFIVGFPKLQARLETDFKVENMQFISFGIRLITGNKVMDALRACLSGI